MTSRELTSDFDFWSRGHFRMAVSYHPTKFGADIFIQFVVVDIFLKFKMAAALTWTFKLCEFGTFHHVSTEVLELCTKFCSNICYSLWFLTLFCSQHSFDDVTRINFRFQLLVMWTSPHSHGAHLYTKPKLNIFFEIRDGSRRHLGFSR